MNPRRVSSSISPIVPGILAIALLVMFFSAWAFVSPVYAYTFLSENFDGVTAPALPAGWSTMTVYFLNGTEPKWATHEGTRYPSGQSAHSAPNVAYFNSFSAQTPNSARLYTTSGINLSGASSLQLTFWMFHDTGYSSNADTVQPQVSTDGGTSWGNVGAAVIRYDGTTGWRQETVDLSAYAGQTDVRIGFLGISSFGNDCHIDDVEVTGDVQPADLTIAKSHSGNFTQGLTGATYTITVTNSGAGPTTGTVTVTDTLPPGLTATGISGTGWTCTQPGGPCTRSDALAASAGYPSITLTVNVAADASASVTNTAQVSGGGEINTDNNTANDATSITPKAAAIPTLTGWGMVLFIVLLGIVSVYHLRRRGKTV